MELCNTATVSNEHEDSLSMCPNSRVISAVVPELHGRLLKLMPSLLAISMESTANIAAWFIDCGGQGMAPDYSSLPKQGDLDPLKLAFRTLYISVERTQVSLCEIGLLYSFQ